MEINLGSYRIVFTQYGPYVERFIPETCTRSGQHRHGHWRLVTGKKREEMLAQARAKRGWMPKGNHRGR